MAKKKREEALPDDFEPVSGKLDGWFLVEEGNTLQGILQDTFTVKGEYGDKLVYKVKLTRDGTRATNKDEGDFDADTGSVIGLDEKGWLKSLRTVAKGSEIYVRCVGKEATAKKGQQPAWKFLVGTKPRKKLDDSDVPF